MAKKSIPSAKINSEAKAIKDGSASTDLERKIFDIPLYKKDGSREGVCDKNPYVVLKYFQKDWECFSDWTKDELGSVDNHASQMTAAVNATKDENRWASLS